APLGQRLVGYVVPEAGETELDADGVVSGVRSALPGYMVPDAVLSMEELPLGSSGKLDRKALPVPEFTGSEAEFRAPTSDTEIVLTEAFADVLGVEEVGVDDSFFALGGDSIVAIQLITRAKDMGLVFKARDVFERKTVAGLAEVAESADRA